ncbi:hypothetical protein GC169_05155 [bacterium]|nr:hypothetical protein [bacterium]
MTSEGFSRLKGEAALIVDLFDMLASAIAPGSKAAAAAARATRLVRALFDALERGGTAYADVVERLNAVTALVAQMRAADRSPGAVEWEALRQEIERASAAIQGA